MTLIIEGRAKSEDARSYRLIPFNVPDNTGRITVRYAFGEELEDTLNAGGGIIDIGIFDPRGAEFMGAGFRGWSGSARREFTISTDEATPGYMPGPIEAGTWQICLGLYEIDPNGCAYHVEIDLETGQQSGATFPELLKLSDAPRTDKRTANGWYKGELHCHTYNSDGDSPPAAIIAEAERIGLDFLAITDHNVLTQHIFTRTAETDLMLIPGMEVTTYRGHWNVWGDAGWLDFRVMTPDDLRRSMAEGIRHGFVVSCNHPKAYGPPWEFTDVTSFHTVEVWNGPWQIFNDQALAFWEDHLRAGRCYAIVGGSDTHFLQREHIAHLGTPTTFIHCEGDPSPAKLLGNLKQGHAFISDSPDGPQVYLSIDGIMVGETVTSQGEQLTVDVQVIAGKNTTLQLYNQNGMVLEQSVESDDWRGQMTLPAQDLDYVRAQISGDVEGEQRVRALTNPIFVEK